MTENIKEKDTNSVGLFNFFITVLLCAIVSLSTVIIYDRYFAQKIVSIDIRSYMDEQRSQYLAGKISNEQLEKNINYIQQVISALPNNNVVLMGDAVVKNAKIIKLERK